MELILKSKDKTFKFEDTENPHFIDTIIETRGRASWDYIMELTKPFIYIDRDNKNHNIISVGYTVDKGTHTKTILINFKQKPLCRQAPPEVLRLIRVAKSDLKQRNWEKLGLVLNKIEEKLKSEI
jgi:hypothetical protein